MRALIVVISILLSLLIAGAVMVAVSGDSWIAWVGVGLVLASGPGSLLTLLVALPILTQRGNNRRVS